MPNHFHFTYKDRTFESDSLERMRMLAGKMIRTECYNKKFIAQMIILNGQVEEGTVRVSWKWSTKEYQYWWFPIKTSKKIHYYRMNEDGTLRYAIERKNQ